MSSELSTSPVSPLSWKNTRIGSPVLLAPLKLTVKVSVLPPDDGASNASPPTASASSTLAVIGASVIVPTPCRSDFSASIRPPVTSRLTTKFSGGSNTWSLVIGTEIVVVSGSSVLPTKVNSPVVAV